MAAMVDTDTARGPLMLSPLLRPSPRLMPPQLPTTAMAALAAMEVMEAMSPTDTARGPLMPMPTTAMADMAVTEAMADTDTARGPLMPRPTMVPDTDMAVMEVMAVVCTDTERGLLMPMLTTAMAAMEVMEAMADTDTARGPLTLTTA